MHAYLLVGNNTEQKVEEISNKLNGEKYFFPIEKIEEVRQLGNFLKHSQPQNTLIVCENVDKASNEALNSFLKNLEEPQSNITYVLTTQNEYNVLPTIISRCQVIRVTGNKKELDSTDIKNFVDLNFGERMLTIDKIRNRPDAVAFLQSMINLLHTTLKTNPQKVARPIVETQKALSAIEANGNVGLQLTNLIVNLNG